MSESDKNKEKGGYFQGHLLVATPLIRVSCFTKSVIYLCVHDASGAMGLIVNQTLDDVNGSLIWDYFNIDAKDKSLLMPIHFGGPVDAARGFILHSDEYDKHSPMHVTNGFAVSSNIDILKDIAEGKGPQQKMLALGYAGWAPGQLEAEIESNSWLTVPASKELVFGTDNASKWLLSAKTVGIDPYKLSADVGHA